jgi:hypothetical protein
MLAVGTTCVVFHETEDGFDEKERDASGHWLSRSSTEEAEKPAPPRKQDKKKKRGGGDDERSAMRNRYARGDGRAGERALQLRIRRRLVSIVRRALTAWMAHWGVSWVSLPPNHASKLLLSEKPHSVAPVMHPWDPKMK